MAHLCRVESPEAPFWTRQGGTPDRASLYGTTQIEADALLKLVRTVSQHVNPERAKEISVPWERRKEQYCMLPVIPHIVEENTDPRYFEESMHECGPQELPLAALSASSRLIVSNDQAAIDGAQKLIESVKARSGKDAFLNLVRKAHEGLINTETLVATSQKYFVVDVKCNTTWLM